MTFQSIFLKKRCLGWHVAKRVSVNQAIKVLGHNGIHVNEEKTEIILDFLYLIARTYSDIRANDDYYIFEPEK